MSLSVCLELTNQSTVEQVVDKQETIQSLKLRIAADCKVHPEYIHLLWNGEVLDDKKSFSAYDIKEKDTVIVKDSPFSIVIQGPFPLCELKTMNVSRRHTIGSFKMEIAQMYDYGDINEFDVRLNGELLTGQTVGQYQIKSNDVLVVTERIVSMWKVPRKISVEHKPYHSPRLEFKQKKEMQDTVFNLFAGKDPSQLKSSSMPDLVIESPDLERKSIVKQAKATRKISMPVLMQSDNSSNISFHKDSSGPHLATVQDESED